MPVEKNFGNSDIQERYKFNGELFPIKKDFGNSGKQKK